MLVVAGVATAAVQTIPPAVKTVQATGSPVLAGSGRAWDGPAVAVLDSGVDVHVDLNVAGGADCTGIGTFADGNGHGTGVSGIIAAKDNASGILGIAPGAPIYSVRVLDGKLKGSPSTIVCGMQWVLDHHDDRDKNIRVVNLSFAAPSTDDGDCGNSSTNPDVMHQMVCKLTDAGLVVVASAGNETKDLSYLVPASYDEVLTATNVADYDGVPGGLGKSPCTALDADDSIYNASNFAVSEADKAHVVAAPGVCPYTTKKGNQVGYIQSGTSMSAAALSGVVLDCLRDGGACVGQSVPQVRATIKSAAAQAAAKGHTFRGDPLSPITGRYYGYLATTAKSGGTTPPPTTTTTTTTTTAQPPTTTTTTTTTKPPTTTTTTTPPPSGCSTAAAKAAVVIPAAVPPLTGAAATASPRTTEQATVEPPLLTLDTTAPLTPEAFPALAAADTTKPQTAITAPRDSATVSGTVCLQAGATDDVGVTGVTYWINGTTKVGDGVRQPSGSWDLAVNTKQLRNGTYGLTSRATDAAGNVGTSTAVKVIVRN
jgi:subtilisin family serine protease